jgi:AcrR family transcriptional regulator
MRDPTRHERRGRPPLSRQRVVGAALAVADAGGTAGLTIRSIAQELGVTPMSVYHHVSGKDEILDGIVDVVFAEIELPVPGGDWRAELRRRAASARRVLREHPWAIGLLESRTQPGPATLRHHDAVLGTLRAAGFSVELTAHAYALLDSFTYGFVLQEVALPVAAGDDATDVTEAITKRLADGQYPHLFELATEVVLQPGCDFGDEFDFGLDLILDALSDLLTGSGARATSGRTAAAD